MSDVPFIDIQHITYSYPRLSPRTGKNAGREEGKADAINHVPLHKCSNSCKGDGLPPLSGNNAQSENSTPSHSEVALRDVTLQIRRGEYLALLGHNGSGKSTLARHCNALLLPESGRVLVDGRDTRDPEQRRAIRESVGMIFQQPDNQLIATVVEDDVAWSLALRGLPRALIRERVEEALEAVDIAHLRHMAPHRLSGGQRQRVAIAGILALRPQCIIADESTSQLDPLSRREVVALLQRLNRELGLTIIHVTHLIEEAAGAQRVVVMEHGRVVLESTPPALFSDLELMRRLKLQIPAPLELAARLRRSGRPIAKNALTIEALAKEIAP